MARERGPELVDLGDGCGVDAGGEIEGRMTRAWSLAQRMLPEEVHEKVTVLETDALFVIRTGIDVSHAVHEAHAKLVQVAGEALRERDRDARKVPGVLRGLDRRVDFQHAEPAAIDPLDVRRGEDLLGCFREICQ